MRYTAISRGESHEVTVERVPQGWRVRVDNHELLADTLAVGASLYSLLIDDRSYEVDVLEMEGAFVVLVSGQPFRVELRQGQQAETRLGTTMRAGQGETVTAPMPGKIVRLLVRPGDTVQPGDGVVVIEAMKMENELKAVAGGRVREVRPTEGKAVNAGEVLVVME